MFYSHEILTSREAGIATVWLVATLGSSSKHRKISRKSIFDVDVPQACNIIIEPQAPMALRLQGNLLYGVARVYGRQYEYVLSDAQVTQANIRAMLKGVQTSSIDKNAGKTAPELLMLPDDPAFVPHAALTGMDFDLHALGILSGGPSARSSQLASQSDRSLSSHQEGDDSMVQLAIPSSDHGGGEAIGGFYISNESTDELAQARGAEDPVIEEELDDPGFIIDGEGNVFEHEKPAEGHPQPETPKQGAGSEVSHEVRAGHLSGPGFPPAEMTGQSTHAADPSYDPIYDNDDLLPQADDLTTLRGPQIGQDIGLPRDSPDEDDEERDPGAAAAPLRPKNRASKDIQPDIPQQVAGRYLRGWQANYRLHMRAEAKKKRHATAHNRHKKRAKMWCLQSGIGGVGMSLGRGDISNPLGNVFAGTALLQALIGPRIALNGRKRAREEEDDEQSDRETQRARLDENGEDEEEQGRGEDLQLADDNDMGFADDRDIEVGRQAPQPLEDPSLPWQLSASRQSSVAHSSRYQGSLGGGFPSSHGGGSHHPHVRLSSIHSGGAYDQRRVSRLTSASPLTGRGIAPRQRDPFVTGDGDDNDNFGTYDLIDDLDIPTDDQFELYGPAAAVSTQQAAESQWIRDALTQESSNFLNFVGHEIEERRAAAQAGDESSENISSISLDDLLPPEQHSRIVAAQAFYHVLALTTANRLLVQQVDTDAFGEIRLEIPDRADGVAAPAAAAAAAAVAADDAASPDAHADDADDAADDVTSADDAAAEGEDATATA